MTEFPERESDPDRQRGAWPKAAGRPIWIGFVILIALALIFVVFAFTRSTRDTDRSSYVAKNEQILEQLKPYPGAELLSKSSHPSNDPNNDTSDSPIIGYTTNVDYQILGGAVAREVADYYGRQLAGWKRHEEVLPCSRIDGPAKPRIDKPAKPCPSVLLVFFTRGEARVSLQLDGLNVPVRKRYELVIDHRGAAQR
jgi:hypothetical protein